MEMFSVLGVQGGMRGIWERMYKRTLTIEILKIYLQQFQCLRNGYKVPPPGFDVHHNDDPVSINVNQLWAHLQGKTSHHMQAQATTWRGSNQPTLLSFFPTLNHNTSRKIPHNLVKKTGTSSIATMSLSNKLSITDVDLSGKRVLIRVNYHLALCVHELLLTRM
jgi:hypothetical protein